MSEMDRGAFVRPIAHRGLHDARRGIVENTASAFAAAIAKGYGIECDLRPAADGLPIVFHDETLNRLVLGKGPVAALKASDLNTLRYRSANEGIITFAELLELVDGDAPLLVEIKSEWNPPDHRFLGKIATIAQRYKGPLALMSFDPGVMAVMRELAPRLPRGIVSGSYRGAGWWRRRVSAAKAAALRDLLFSAPAAPQFYAYEVNALPTSVTRYLREVDRLPLFTWTVRTPKQRALAAKWADAPIFEGFEP